MKSLFRVIRRYCVSVGVIILVMLVCNGCLLIGAMYLTAGQEGMERYSRVSMEIMEQVGEALGRKSGDYVLSEGGIRILEESEFVWAMALDETGSVVWQWRLPQAVPRQYDIQDVAAFTRWYLADYPVKVLIKGELLLVFGCDPQMLSRYNAFIATSFVRNLPFYLKMVVLLNLLVIFVITLFLGYRFYSSMKPMAQGIEDLAAQRPVHLKEKGTAGELAGRLNEASELLLAKNEALAKRDLARTEWIAGVSHDIRTPLSLIVGHSDRLARDESISGENRMLAENIRKQSLIIRQLIADLNLTSKLAYDAQPLKKVRCAPAALIRSCVSDVCNEGLETEEGGEYEFEIVMDEEMERVQIEADEGLFKRALRNLLGNSVRHNPNGCRVRVSLTEKEEKLFCLVEDTGMGIPREVVDNMDNRESHVHIMGLRVAEQIVKAHGGELEFVERAGGGYDVGLLFTP